MLPDLSLDENNHRNGFLLQVRQSPHRGSSSPAFSGDLQSKPTTPLPFPYEPRPVLSHADRVPSLCRAAGEPHHRSPPCAARLTISLKKTAARRIPAVHCPIRRP